MNPLVSVVVPIKNMEKYLIKCVNSITKQSYENIEIILIDDGSTDASFGICEELKKTDTRISVVHKQNGGLSSARNAGIYNANGKYIMFVDADDTIKSNTVENMVNIITQEQSDAVIPMSYYKVYEKFGKTEQTYHFDENMFSQDPKKFALDVLIGKGRASRATAVLYSLNVINDNKIIFPQGLISEDFFFNLKFLASARKISVYTEPSLYNLKREGSLSSSYHEDFFDTILLIDDEVQSFIENLENENNKYDVFGKRETLLFKNVLFYAISVMGHSGEPYSTRVRKCKRMLKNERVKNAVENGAQAPYFPSKLKRMFVKTNLLLMKIRLYDLVCLATCFASKR